MKADNSSVSGQRITYPPEVVLHQGGEAWMAHLYCILINVTKCIVIVNTCFSFDNNFVSSMIYSVTDLTEINKISELW